MIQKMPGPYIHGARYLLNSHDDIFTNSSYDNTHYALLNIFYSNLLCE